MSGSARSPGKRTGSNPDTAPRAYSAKLHAYAFPLATDALPAVKRTLAPIIKGCIGDRCHVR